MRDGDPVLRLLEGGEMEILGLLPRSSNYTFLARVTGEEDSALAVYKPRRGETPLWDFPEGTLCRREVAAYLVAGELGWPTVPPTVLREGPEGPGSAQLFVEFDPSQHYFTLEGTRPDDFHRIVLFDLVVNNADRKAGHCLVTPGGGLVVVDHGVCFSTAPKLRTVIWEFAGETVPPPMKADVLRLERALRRGPLRDSLCELLTAEEVDATVRRAGAVARAERFPHPGPGRPYPWPPV